jgi:hypothetical protein
VKVTVTRLFDIALVATTDAYKQLQAFIDNQVSINDNFYRILLNNVSLADNVSGTFQTVTLKHNVPTQIGLTKTPVGVIILNTVPLTPFVTSVNYERLKDNQYSLIGLLSDPTYTKSVSVNLYFFNN